VTTSNHASIKRAKPREGIRWWPVAVILTLAASTLFWIWGVQEIQRQNKVVETFLTLIGAGALLMIWMLLLSRLRWWARLLALAAVITLIIAAGFSLRIRGVSGDLVPILEWRWARGDADLPVAGTSGEGAIPPRSRELTGDSTHSHPQFLGAARTGIVTGVRLARDWDTRPPEELWRRPVGRGWSGFAVVDGLAVTLEQRGTEELVTCYDLETGELIWAHGDPVGWDDPLGGPGPRGTPTIDGGEVFTLGGTGLLNVLDLATGELKWSIDVLEDNGAPSLEYGIAASPLVRGDEVIVPAGGRNGALLVAYDRSTGERRWAGGDDPAAYSSPLIAELAGVEQIVLLNEDAVAGHDADSGQLLWRREWPGGTEMVAQPVVLPGSRLFVSTGYDIGGKLFEITGGPAGVEARTIWESRGLKAKLSNVVHKDGYLYGLDDGILVCLDVDDGRRKWKRGRYGHGQLLLVDDLLLIQAENGDVALVEASPMEFRELARIPVLDGKTWNHPALAGPYLLVRNDREAACLRLSLNDSLDRSQLGLR
jgi:outer membrane protein assembly factor BamB